MGSTLSHAEKIIALYMDGYTETEIKRRTGHSYDSIENYLWNFSRAICLTERGMPLPAIRRAAVDNYLRLFDRVLVLLYFRMPPHLMRQVTGHSLALINEHLALAKKHFPAEKDLVGYLTNRGVDLEKAQ